MTRFPPGYVPPPEPPAPAPRQPLEAWRQQPGESPEAYQAFEFYRNLEPPRPPLLLVARNVNLDPFKAQEYFAQWSWRARADAFDQWYEDHHKQIERQRLLAESEESIETKHRTILAMAREVSISELGKLLARSKQGSFEALARPGDLIRLLQLTLELDKSLQESSKEKAAAAAENWGDGMTDEELAEFDRLAKLGARSK